MEEAISDVLARSFVGWISKEQQNQRGWVLDVPEFRNVAVIFDCTVQQMNKPAVEFKAAKAWFSGKHFIYCIKSELALSENGSGNARELGPPGCQARP
jgi:hypothetical protein